MSEPLLLVPGLACTADLWAPQVATLSGRVECRVADAQGLAIGQASFDAAICRLGLMLMPDPAAAGLSAPFEVSFWADHGACTWAALRWSGIVPAEIVNEVRRVLS